MLTSDLIFFFEYTRAFRRVCIQSPPRGLPYMAYKGTRRWTGYGFWPLCPKQGI